MRADLKDSQLLDNLFRLNGQPTTVGPKTPAPGMSPGDTVSNVVFEPAGWSSPVRRVREVTFRNVSFSGTTISKVTFSDSTFEDCLFVGAKLDQVEFHGCKFRNCNFWKADFNHVYIDPHSIALDGRYRAEAANIGISVFQSLLANFSAERQDEYFMRADILFRRWKRYQIWHDLRRKRIGRCAAISKWGASITYELAAGFGYKPWRIFGTTVILFLAVSYLNYLFIGSDVIIAGAEIRHASFVDTVFYTFSILTILGFSSIVPSSSAAKLLTVFEALVAIGWLGILTSVFVKRVLR